MKKPKYPHTPMRNCLYCRWFNETANCCDHPKAAIVATFNPNEEKDCLILDYEKSENPEVPELGFTEKYCVGKKCPYYYASKRLCTRPSLCPYKGEEVTVFTNVKLKQTEETD